MPTEGEGCQGERRACHTLISHRKDTQVCEITIAEGGQLIELHGPGFKGVINPGGLRTTIHDFSVDSRRRLQRRLATINEYECDLPDFLTLTYPGEYSTDWRRWKRDLDAFIKALVRRYPTIWGLWRLEFQERGAPHFHFLLWSGPQVEGMEVYNVNKQKLMVVAKPGSISPHNEAVFTWLSESWYRIVGSGDPYHLAAGSRIEPIQTWNGVRSYASKYLAKLPDGNFVPSDYKGTGRFWGCIGKSRWKSTMFQHEIPERVFFRVKRVLRKRLEKKGINPWRMKLRGRGMAGMATFLDSALALRILNWAWLENEDCPF